MGLSYLTKCRLKERKKRVKKKEERKKSSGNNVHDAISWDEKWDLILVVGSLLFSFFLFESTLKQQQQ